MRKKCSPLWFRSVSWTILEALPPDLRGFVRCAKRYLRNGPQATGNIKGLLSEIYVPPDYCVAIRVSTTAFDEIYDEAVDDHRPDPNQGRDDSGKNLKTDHAARVCPALAWASLDNKERVQSVDMNSVVYQRDTNLGYWMDQRSF